MRYRKLVKIFLLLILLVIIRTLNAQTLSGKIIDGSNNEPLSFATISVLNTTIGSLSDLEGNYVLTNLPKGIVSFSFSYLGYAQKDTSFEINAGVNYNLDVILYQSGIKLDEVVISTQAIGQKAAINQQINSNTIVNVVSREKLQELPDQNAAEAVGRLAGVSVYRDAGEGQRISIRGVSPRLNSVTINGQRMASTQGNDRSTDLSMISPDMLDGIELFKALTPDKDGDAIGGSVNFTIAKAKEGKKGVIRMLGTYNNYVKNYNNFQSNINFSNRTPNNKFGFLLTGNYQSINRSSEGLDSSYEFLGVDAQGDANLIIGGLNLVDNRETRKRYGGSATFDFSPNEFNTIIFNTSLGFTDRDELRYRKRYIISNAELRLEGRDQVQNINVQSYSLKGNHKKLGWTLDWLGSLNTSRQNNPNSINGIFFENGAITGPPQNPRELESIPSVFRNNLLNTALRQVNQLQSVVSEENLSLQLDLRKDLKINRFFGGYLKVGGKLRKTTRERDVNGLFLRPYLANENVARQNPDLFITTPSGLIALNNFMGDFSTLNFFNGRFDVQPGTSLIRSQTSQTLEKIDINAFNALFGTNYSIGDKINFDGHIDASKLRSFYDKFENRFQTDLEREFDDYSGAENIYATYAMLDMQLGKYFSTVLGVRSEETRQNYQSTIGSPVEDGDPNTGFPPEVIERASGYSDLLPMFHLKIKPVGWADVRLAATKTLARPDFFNLVPWERINASERTIRRGKPDLLNTNSWNYDIFASFYNKFGLLTMGAFYKQLINIDYIATRAVNDLVSSYNGFIVTEPANSPKSTVRGLEFDVQANFTSLSNRFLKGIVIGANTTILKSNTSYPLFSISRVSNPTPPPFFITRVIDSLRSGPIVGQPDLIANAYFGYETKRFSGRISYLFQGSALSPEEGIGIREEQDSYDQSFTRMDIALKYKIDKKGKYVLISNINNLLNTPEIAFLKGSKELLITRERYFGATIDLGFSIRFL